MSTPSIKIVEALMDIRAILGSKVFDCVAILWEQLKDHKAQEKPWSSHYTEGEHVSSHMLCLHTGPEGLAS